MGFAEYYSWLREDLKVTVFGIDKWANNVMSRFEGRVEKANYDLLQPIYGFLDEYRLSDYTKTSKIYRQKSKYEEDVQLFVKKAWPVLRTARILVNAENDFVAAVNANNEAQVFMSSTSEYHKIAKSAVVLSYIADEYKTLLEDSFGIKEFDNFEYVKGKVLVKYSHTPITPKVTDSFIREYANDILQICQLMASSSYAREIQELIADRCLILAQNSDGVLQLNRPGNVYREKSVEGADMEKI